jgi:hypothetical protein
MNFHKIKMAVTVLGHLLPDEILLHGFLQAGTGDSLAGK